ncbi:MAG TPA: ABC transporter permease subunit [Pirellulales bacterium]|jgi:ABC-type transport system involved in multi-copper enzyme maturation permease subunit
MFFAPIITLDLVTAARRMRYFIVRVIYASILLFLLWLNYAESRVGYGGTASIHQVAEFSATFFITFSAAQLAAIMLLTPAMIAGSVAQERERKTIEYLFSSTLTNGEIVLSKYVARTVHVAAILAVGLPVLSITMMLGGVDPELLLMSFLVTLATLIGLAALSIAVSVRATRGRDAVVRTYVLLIGFLALPGLCHLLAMFITYSAMAAGQNPGAAPPPDPGVFWNVLYWIIFKGGELVYFNPFYVLTILYSQRFGGISGGSAAWEAVGYFIAGYLAYTAVILTWSTLSIRRVYRKSVGVGSVAKRRVKWFAELRRRPAVGDQPMIWKEMFAESAAINVGRAGRVIVSLIFAGIIVYPYYLLFETRYNGGSYLRESVSEYTIIFTAILLHAALLIIMVRAAGSITAERERDSWLTLISTPMTGAEIVWGKIAGSLFSARWFLVPIGLMWLLTGFLWPEMLLILPVLLGIFACVALAVAATGVWFSCWCATSIRAIASSVGIAIFVGGGYMLCCTPVIIASRGDESMILSLALCVPMLLGAPAAFWQSSLQGYNSAGKESGLFITAMIIGTIAYFFIGLLMASATIGNFDALTGRSSRLQDPLPRPPRPRPPGTLPGPLPAGAGPLATEPQV